MKRKKSYKGEKNMRLLWDITDVYNISVNLAVFLAHRLLSEGLLIQRETSGLRVEHWKWRWGKIASMVIIINYLNY